MIGRSLQLRDLANLAHRLDAVHLRHHDVHQHDVDRRVVAAAIGSRRGRCRPRSISMSCSSSTRRQGEDVAHVVVDDQHLLAGQDAVGLDAGRSSAWRSPSGSSPPTVQEQSDGMVQQPLGRAAVAQCRIRVEALSSADRASASPVAVDDDRQLARSARRCSTASIRSRRLQVRTCRTDDHAVDAVRAAAARRLAGVGRPTTSIASVGPRRHLTIACGVRRLAAIDQPDVPARRATKSHELQQSLDRARRVVWIGLATNADRARSQGRARAPRRSR